MNALGIALVWCVAQVTLMGLLCGGLYLGVRKLRPAAAAPVAMTGLVVVVLLSALVLSPWPVKTDRRLTRTPRRRDNGCDRFARSRRIAPGDGP